MKIQFNAEQMFEDDNIDATAVAGLAAKNIMEGQLINDKLADFRATLAGGEITKMLEKVGNGQMRDYERNMQVKQIRRQQSGGNVHEQAQAEFEEFARREAELLAKMHLKDGEEEYKGDYRELTDYTEVGGKIWRDLKVDGMKDGYQQQAWFVSFRLIWSRCLPFLGCLYL